MPKLNRLASTTLKCLVFITTGNVLLVVRPSGSFRVQNVVVSVSTTRIAMRFDGWHRGNYESLT